MSTACTTINEERLFKLLPYFFKHPSSVLVELVQNAQRAGATKVRFEIKDGMLLYSDDGKGLTEHGSLFILADSKWDEKVEKEQNPAGWGLFFLYSISEEVEISSQFGTIKVDCVKYLNDSIYRTEIIQNKKHVYPVTFKGLKIKARLMPGVHEKLLTNTKYLGYSYIDVYINGEKVERQSISSNLIYSAVPTIKTEYYGNKVMINITDFFPVNYRELARRMIVNWYGTCIIPDSHATIHVAIQVTQGSPLTPILPVRYGIVEDEKLEKFYEFVRDTAVKYCIEKINSINSKNMAYLDKYEKNTLIEMMRFMNKIATDEELNKLEYFYVEDIDCHYTTDPDSSETLINQRIVSKNEAFQKGRTISKVVIVGKEEYEKEFVLTLPEGTITTVYTVPRYPSWLKIENTDSILEVACIQEHKSQGLHYNWMKGKILIKDNHGEELVVPVAAVSYYYDTPLFVYTEKPEDIYDIEYGVFCSTVYDEDHDTFDTQKYEYDRALEKDIRIINEKVDISDLLDEILYTKEVKIKFIKEIRLDVENMKGDILLKDGSSKTINIFYH